MNMIVAVDKNWSIGKDGHLLVSIPADQKLFREENPGEPSRRAAFIWKDHHRAVAGPGVQSKGGYSVPQCGGGPGGDKKIPV